MERADRLGVQTRRESGAWRSKHSKILSAALDEFIAHGFVGASMDQIANRAKVSKVTIYNHFENKDELYQETIKTYLDEVHPTLPAVDAQGGTVRDCLVRHGRQVIEMLMAPRTLGMIRLLRADPGQFISGAEGNGQKAGLEARLLPDIHGLVDFFSRVAARGEYEVANPEITARQYYGMLLENTVYPALLGKPVNSSGDALAEVVTTCVDTLLCTCEPHHH